MPLIKSAIKRNRQAVKRRAHNLRVKAAVKADIKAVLVALEASPQTVVQTYQAAQSQLDRAVKKGTLHKNAAARKKARLSAVIAKTLGETHKPASKPIKAKAAPKKPAKPKTKSA